MKKGNERKNVVKLKQIIKVIKVIKAQSKTKIKSAKIGGKIKRNFCRL